MQQTEKQLLQFDVGDLTSRMIMSRMFIYDNLTWYMESRYLSTPAKVSAALEYAREYMPRSMQIKWDTYLHVALATDTQVFVNRFFEMMQAVDDHIGPPPVKPKDYTRKQKVAAWLTKVFNL